MGVPYDLSYIVSEAFKALILLDFLELYLHINSCRFLYLFGNLVYMWCTNLRKLVHKFWCMILKYQNWCTNTDKNKGFTPKTLRHTGCTMYASEGMDVSVLQYIMGHKSSYTTMRFYNHVTEERVIDTFQDHINKNAQDRFEKHIHRSA